jgi:hypothetical protein
VCWAVYKLDIAERSGIAGNSRESKKKEGSLSFSSSKLSGKKGGGGTLSLGMSRVVNQDARWFWQGIPGSH